MVGGRRRNWMLRSKVSKFSHYRVFVWVAFGGLDIFWLLFPLFPFTIFLSFLTDDRVREGERGKERKRLILAAGPARLQNS